MVSPAASHGLDEVGDEDLFSGGSRAEPRRLDDGDPEDIVVLDGDVTTRDSDPHLVRFGMSTGVTVDRLLDSDGRAQRVRGTQKRREDSVAQPLDDSPATPVDRIGQQAIMDAAKFICRLFADTHPEFSGTDEVSDKNRCSS